MTGGGQRNPPFAHAVFPLAVLGFVASSGCKKRSAPTDPVVDFGEVTAVEDEPLLVAGRRPVGPGRWSAAGWSVFVPPGWSGDQGDAPNLLTVYSDQTGVGFALWSFDEPLNAPRPADGQDCPFVDSGRFRTVPVLGLARSATCTGDEGVRQTWWGRPPALGPDGPEVHVEAFYPTGRMIRGRQDVAPMLEGLSLVVEEAGQPRVSPDDDAASPAPARIR